MQNVLRVFALASTLLAFAADAQTTYANPVLFSDYSDPDVLRVGADYYLVASSFTFSPGLPILHSRDLVHWDLLTHALPRLDLGPLYDLENGNRYGRGVWAPALQEHNGPSFCAFLHRMKGFSSPRRKRWPEHGHRSPQSSQAPAWKIHAHSGMTMARRTWFTPAPVPDR